MSGRDDTTPQQLASEWPPDVAPGFAPQPASSPAAGYTVPSTPTRTRARPAGWLLLTRPPTLTLTIAPAVVTLAALWARSVSINAALAIALLVALALASAAANMLDEYLEYERLAKSNWMQAAGGSYYENNLVADSGLQPITILRVSIALFVLSVVVSVPLIVAGGVPLIILGLLGLAVAFFYSATSFALKRLPAGELCILLALGPGVVAATLLSQRQRVTASDLLIGFALGFFALALVEATHLRDMDADKLQGRKTLATQLGVRGAHIIFAVSLVAAYLLIALAAFPHGAAHGALLAFLSLPVTIIPLTGGLRTMSANVRHLVVRQTLRAYVYFAGWLIIGLLLTGIVVRFGQVALHYFH